MTASLPSIDAHDDLEADPSSKRERTKLANRQAILAAARRVFGELGYQSATVRDVIRETELASGTFYNYFKSKEEVFQALADESAARIRPLLRAVRQNSETFEQYVTGALTTYFRFIVDANESALAIGPQAKSLIGVRVDTPEMLTIFDEIHADLESYLAASAHAGVDADYLTAAAIALAREIGDHMLARNPRDPDGAARFAASLLFGGYRALPRDPNRAG